MKKFTTTAFAFFLTVASFAQVGIGTTSPNTTLDVRGSLAANSRSFSTTSESVLSTDYTLLFTGSSACSLTLPDATGCIGRIIYIKNTKTGAVPLLTIATTAAQTIDGLTTWLLDDPNEAVNVVSDGLNWRVLGAILPSGSGTSWTQGGNTVGSIKKLGTIDNFDLPFITNNTEKMRLTAGGFLGIGTTAPAGRLHMVSQNSESGNDYIFDDYGSAVTQGFFIRKSRGTVASPLNLANNDLISYFRFSGRFNNALNYTAGSGFDVYYKGDGTNDLTDMRFFTSGTEQMRIDENGSVGIGTSSFDPTTPEKVLIDAGSGTNTGLGIQGTIDDFFQLNVQNFSNGHSASSDVCATANNGTDNGYYVDLGINSQGYTNARSNILNGGNTAYLYANAADFYIGNGAPNKDLIFFTNTGAWGDNTANGNERMRITSAGTMSINSSSPNTTYKLYVNGSAISNNWAVFSDRRLKTNIHSLSYGLKEVMSIQPVSYNWIDTTASRQLQIGVIAQDLRKVIPEAVNGNEKEETLSVNYTELIPVLVNAIKEQQKEIEELKKAIEKLKK